VTCTAFRIFSAKPRVEPPRAERPWSTVIFGLMTSEIALLTRLRAFGADVRVFAKFVDRFRSPHISAKVLMVWEIAEGRRVLECPVLSGCRWFCRRARGGRFFWGEPGRGGAPARRVSRHGDRGWRQALRRGVEARTQFARRLIIGIGWTETNCAGCGCGGAVG
jgi:hypothetical protein